jgi:hypothetical protein
MHSDRVFWAVSQMRSFQQKEEQARSAVTDRQDQLKKSYAKAYKETNRETFGAFDETIIQRSNADEVRRTLIGDEQFYRGLVHMYAEIARVELAIDEARSREQKSSCVCNVGPPRTQ